MTTKKLYMTIIGCKPEGRFTEQHDVYFGIAENLPALLPQLKSFWPEAANTMHLDAFRTVTNVDGYTISIVPKSTLVKNEVALFFINLGGYKPNEMEEFHYKMIVIAKDKSEAIQKSKQTAFYKHTGFGKANSHIDDKYGIDVDDIYAIEDLFSPDLKAKYKIQIQVGSNPQADELHLGYFMLKKIEQGNFEAS